MMTAWRKMIWFGLGLAATLTLLATVNLIVDPSRLFRGGGPEQRLAAALIAGKYMAGAGNYDERQAQRLIIERRATPPAPAVFGSSRIMPVGASVLGPDTFNHAVSGGTLQDTVGLLGLYEDRGLILTQVILALDPWVFNAHSQMNDWQTLADAVDRQRRRLGQPTAVESTRSSSRITISSLISIDYFFSSLHALGRLGNDGGWHERDDDNSPLAVRRADGSLKYPTQSRDPEAVAAGAAQWAAADAVYAMSKYQRLDSDMTALLEAQLDRLANAGTNVRLVLVPLHPAAWRILSARPDMKMIAIAEDYLRQQAKRRGLTLQGSYDPDRVGCPASEFMDALHPDESCLARILAADKT